MYFIYILYSAKADKFYIGYSIDPFHRVQQHNSIHSNTFTSKFRPWKLAAVFECSNIEAEAMKIERFIKKQKSRKLIEKLCQQDFKPDGKLAQLVTVPNSGIFGAFNLTTTIVSIE